MEGDDRGELRNSCSWDGNACTGLQAALRSAMRSAEQELAEYIHLRERRYIDEICRLHKRLELQVIENNRLAKLVSIGQPHPATMVDELQAQTCFGPSSQKPKPIKDLNGLHDDLHASNPFSHDESDISSISSVHQPNNLCSCERCKPNHSTKKTSTKIPPRGEEGIVVAVVGQNATVELNHDRKKIREHIEDAIMCRKQQECNTKDQVEAHGRGLHGRMPSPKPSIGSFLPFSITRL